MLHLVLGCHFILLILILALSRFNAKLLLNEQNQNTQIHEIVFIDFHTSNHCLKDFILQLKTMVQKRVYILKFFKTHVFYIKHFSNLQPKFCWENYTPSGHYTKGLCSLRECLPCYWSNNLYRTGRHPPEGMSHLYHYHCTGFWHRFPM